MAPKIGKMTTVGRKVFNSLLYHAQQELVRLKAQNIPHESKDLFKTRLVDLLKPINVDPNSSMSSVKKYIKDMRTSEVEWSSPEAKTGIIWMSMSLVSSVYLAKENGSNWLYWSFPPQIIESLYDLERFTVIKLEELSKLDSYAAVALYEICAKYANNPTHLTCVNEPDWWVIALSSDSKKAGPDGEPPKVRLWKSFKVERAIPAINEINEKTNLFIELIENRVGTKIVSIQFKVIRNSFSSSTPSEQALQPPVVVQSSEEVAVMTLAVQLGLHESNVIDLIAAGYRLDQISFFLEKFQARLNRSDLGEIGNKKRFFEKMIDSDELMSPIVKSLPVEVDVINDHTTKIGKSEKTSISLVKLVDVTVIDKFSDEFSCLPDEVKNHHLNQLAVDLKGRGLLTPVTHRKILSGEWQSPIILNYLKSLMKVTT